MKTAKNNNTLQVMNSNGQSMFVKPLDRFIIANKINRFLYASCGMVMLFYIFLSTCGCSVRENNPKSWNPDTYKLDQAGLDNADLAELRHDVTNFYALLREKDWQATYKLRWQSFRENYPEALYLDTAQKAGASWGLVNYSILSIEIHDSGEAIIRCKFVESPDSSDGYSVVRWRREKDGVWRCDSAGPSGLSIFKYIPIGKKPDGN